MQLHRVEKDHLRGYRRWLDTRGLSPQTVTHILADARCFFRWCEEVGYVERAPIPRRLFPKLQERVPRGLSEAEVELLLELPDPWRFVIRLGLATGMRWSEMCRAEARHLTRDGWLEVEQTKSGKVRWIPLPETDPVLAAEISRREGRLTTFRENSVGTFNRTVREKVQVPGFSCHRLRHTFATNWLSGRKHRRAPGGARPLRSQAHAALRHGHARVHPRRGTTAGAGFSRTEGDRDGDSAGGARCRVTRSARNWIAS